MELVDETLEIRSLKVQNIRWPTSKGSHGSDAMHSDPDYSLVYVTILTNSGAVEGNGMTFTLGRGTELVAQAVNSMKFIVEGRNLREIYSDFASFWRQLTSDPQLRWIGPEKGVAHLAVSAIINGLWDLWAKLNNLPLWKLLVNMEPKLLVSTIDFRYLSEVITPAEAVAILEKGFSNRNERIGNLLENGYPAYTTQVGWLGYDDATLRGLCKKYLDLGFTAFKIKVGRDLKEDLRRSRIVREEIGPNNILMMDANQIWDVNEAIQWMGQLAHFNPLWIEEPTSPDDVLGHATIAREMRKLKIGVATGEMCCNRVMFKQFLQSGAMDFCQIDSARIGGVNEILSVYLMAKKLNVKVCPHAGGVGLCEMVQHLQMWDYVAVSGTKEGRYIEYVDQQHEQFVHPVVVENASYMAPTEPGYSSELKPEAIEEFEFPGGLYWATENCQ